MSYSHRRPFLQRPNYLKGKGRERKEKRERECVHNRSLRSLKAPRCGAHGKPTSSKSLASSLPSGARAYVNHIPTSSSARRSSVLRFISSHDGPWWRQCRQSASTHLLVTVVERRCAIHGSALIARLGLLFPPLHTSRTREGGKARSALVGRSGHRRRGACAAPWCASCAQGDGSCLSGVRRANRPPPGPRVWGKSVTTAHRAPDGNRRGPARPRDWCRARSIGRAAGRGGVL